MANSTAKKPGKPYADFPLFAHAAGYWAKKIRGKLHYFGKWDDWQGALEAYEKSVHAIQRTGKKPDLTPAKLSVGDMVNYCLEYKEGQVKTGELSERTYADYKRIGEQIIERLGRYTDVAKLTPDDFATVRAELAEGQSLKSLHSRMTNWLVFFNYAYAAGLVEHPIRTGMHFKKPSAKALKKEKQSKPGKYFEVDELRQLYRSASPTMKAFILLALNGGMGPADIGQLQQWHIKEGWIHYPRPKTGENRDFPLWPETIEAIEAVAKPGEYVFLTKYGKPWHKQTNDSPISKEFRKLLDDCGLHRKGRGFYALRHVFRTLCDDLPDIVAINRVMGHSNGDIADHYREYIDPTRLQTVVDHVRAKCLPLFFKCWR